MTKRCMKNRQPYQERITGGTLSLQKWRSDRALERDQPGGGEGGRRARTWEV